MEKRRLIELNSILADPPEGVHCWAKEESNEFLTAQIQGPQGSPYEDGCFSLSIHLHDRYPYEPPTIKFVTPIYHPNIDKEGRICLDLLKVQPNGSWRPAISLGAVLTSIRFLMAEPNPSDPLCADIAKQFTNDRQEFDRISKSETIKHAVRVKDVEPEVPATRKIVETITIDNDENQDKAIAQTHEQITVKPAPVSLKGKEKMIIPQPKDRLTLKPNLEQEVSKRADGKFGSHGLMSSKKPRLNLSSKAAFKKVGSK